MNTMGIDRHTISNIAVALAGALANTNADADTEIAVLQSQVQQLQAALAQARPVVVAAREAMQATPISTGETADLPVPVANVRALREALKGCA